MYALHIQVRIEDDIVVTANGMELLKVEASMQQEEKTWMPPTPAS